MAKFRSPGYRSWRVWDNRAHQYVIISIECLVSGANKKGIWFGPTFRYMIEDHAVTRSEFKRIVDIYL